MWVTKKIHICFQNAIVILANGLERFIYVYFRRIRVLNAMDIMGHQTLTFHSIVIQAFNLPPSS